MTKKNGGSPQGRDRSGQQGGPGLSLTPVSALLLAAAATALVVGVAAVYFYGNFPPARVRNSVALWIIAAVAAVTAVAVRRRVGVGDCLCLLIRVAWLS